MSRVMRSLSFWTLRILGIVFTIYLSAFAFDVFGEGLLRTNGPQKDIQRAWDEYSQVTRLGRSDRECRNGYTKEDGHLVPENPMRSTPQRPEGKTRHWYTVCEFTLEP
jgi:hypothetical protein